PWPGTTTPTTTSSPPEHSSRTETGTPAVGRHMRVPTDSPPADLARTSRHPAPGPRVSEQARHLHEPPGELGAVAAGDRRHGGVRPGRRPPGRAGRRRPRAATARAGTTT